jgi:hypothetical protein
MKKEILPKIKNTFSDFLLDNRGRVAKHKVVSLGAFLSSVSVLSFIPEVAAAHSNSFDISWNSGTITAQHAHHASHSSHGSHASHGSHGSHASHGSHGSHSSHGSHGSHASHASHASHGSHSSS